jgi:hypothetical protein
MARLLRAVLRARAPEFERSAAASWAVSEQVIGRSRYASGRIRGAIARWTRWMVRDPSALAASLAARSRPFQGGGHQPIGTSRDVAHTRAFGGATVQHEGHRARHQQGEQTENRAVDGFGNALRQDARFL